MEGERTDDPPTGLMPLAVLALQSALQRAQLSLMAETTCGSCQFIVTLLPRIDWIFSA